jgi:hypothetical protein
MFIITRFIYYSTDIFPEMDADLMAIKTAIEMLTKKIDDTQTEVCCEALDSALAVYAYAKKSTLTAELETLVSVIGQRFSKNARVPLPCVNCMKRVCVI